MISFDTSAIIYYLQKVQPYRRWLEPFIDSVEAGNRLVVLSVLAEAELLVHPLRHSSEDAIDRARAFVDDRSVTLVEVDRALAYDAAALRARHNLTLVDSVIVATAIVSGCDALIGNDRTCARRVTEIPYIYLDEVAGRSPA